jgi:hypothetical protein
MRRFGLWAAGLATSVFLLTNACEDTKQTISAEGGSCGTVADCEPGLACVASGSGRVCQKPVVGAPVPFVDTDATTDATSDTSTLDAETDATDADLDGATDASDAGDGSTDASDASDSSDAADGGG